jgi:magnesium chelatase family protein
VGLAVALSRASVGIAAPQVVVEVNLAGGLPATNIVGLPEAAVREARDRVRVAVQSAAFEYPDRRITVNLAPAELPKDGGRFDLPIALGILAASGQVPRQKLESCEFLGELALTGALRPVSGVLPALLQARVQGRGMVVPRANAAEAALVGDMDVRVADSLAQVCAWLHGADELAAPERVAAAPACAGPDLRDVRGQLQARRALEIAAVGGHHLLLVGPPGTGKTMLAERLPGILPPLSEAEALETCAVLSVAGQAGNCLAQWGQRPFRAPHHTASGVALVGGGSVPRPGEISLAHNGVLFLDELPEFTAQALDSLRQPIETGEVAIARANHRITYPARFMLVAAMNPCRCGRASDPGFACKRGPNVRCGADYQARLSGPLLDRIDLHIEVPGVSASDLILPPPSEGSREVSARVARARDIQAARYQALKLDGVRTNAQANGPVLEEIAQLDGSGTRLLRDAADAMRLSARGYHRVLRVARTLADLDGADKVGRVHLAEALSYRALADEIRRAA